MQQRQSFIEESLRLTRMSKLMKMEILKSFKEWPYPCGECIVRAMCKRELFGDSCIEYFEWFIENLINGEKYGNTS
jgi:hypothetical protein